jgi:REP element-mobilizing transposase RayT
LVTELRRPVFADVRLAKSVLACLLSDETLTDLRVRAFTLMPNHLHLLAGVQQPELYLPDLIGKFKSYTTQRYWKRSHEVIASGQVSLPATSVAKSDDKESESLTSALLDWKATLRPEVVELKNWPAVKPEHFLKKHLWQARFFDHVIRNNSDLEQNIDYLALNSLRAGYVTHPQFYPYTGFLH